MMDDNTRVEAWRRLTAGAPMQDMGLPTVNGRIDLRGFVPPTDTFNVAITGRWTDLDLSGSKLPSLRFRSAVVTNCVIDGSQCRDWRVWDTVMARCSVARSDLRDAALSGLDQGRRNSYQDVDFSRADLRNTAHTSADFVRCRFIESRLRGVDFAGDVFVDCVFAGSLKEVLFHRHAFKGEALPANEMRGVDLRDTVLELAEFRNIDLVHALLPQNDAHVVLSDVRAAIECVIKALALRSDDGSRRLAEYIAAALKWVPAGTPRGVFHRGELQKVGGAAAVAAMLHAMRPWIEPHRPEAQKGPERG